MARRRTLSWINAAAVASWLLAMPPAVHAADDAVTLTNGDRISGTFRNVADGKLTLQTAIGPLSIPVSQIEQVSLAGPAVVVIRKGPILRGTIDVAPPAGWTITGDAGDTEYVASSSIEAILTESRYAAIVDRAAAPWQDWTGTASVGYSLQRGNQQTNTFTSGIDARRERPVAPIFRPHWRTNVHLTTLSSNAEQSGVSIGANTLSSSARQDLFFAPGNFIFGIAQFDHVAVEGLSLRQTYGGGAGYDATRTTRGTFSVFAGLTFVRETFFTGEDQQTAQLLIGEKFRFQLTSRVRLDHTLNAYPNVSVFGRYHLDTRTTLDMKLTDRFSLNTGLIDLYLTNPSPGAQRNSFALTSGIGVTF